MLDSFEKESKLHSRRAARARQMKLMEEAAAGLPLSDEADQYSTTSSSNNLAPDNKIAERFSIDDGDEDEGPPSIFTDTASSHLWSSRTGHDLDREELNFVLGTNNNNDGHGASSAASNNNKLKSFTSGWTSRKEHEESRKLIMMASRRLNSDNNVNISPFGVDREDDDDIENNNYLYQQQRHRIILPMCCLDNLKYICALSLLAVALVAIIVAPSVLVNRNNTDGEVPWNPWAGGKETPLDMARFDRIKDRILEHRISHASVLEDPSSPQYKALAWLVRDDERHVDLPQIDDEGSKMTGNNVDDEIALFQRYALAVFWFQTTDAEIVEESLGMTVEHPRDIAWNNANGWMTSKGLCLWYGVTCHPHQSGVKYDGDFHVAMLNLTSNNIHGVLPVEIFTAFLKMTVLDLHQNELAGTLGRELANMVELEDLFLNGNSFKGQLPDNIGALRSLQNLNVHDNEFDGPIPVSIGELENLRELGMFNNQFTGRIPLSIGNLKNLIALYLESNQLTGNIPPVIGQLTALEDIRLRNNMLNGPIPTEIGELKELRTVYLDTNKLSGAIPTELGTLYKLDDLQMYENGLKGKLPVELAFLSGLTTLYLDANGLTGSLPEEFGEMHALEELIISSNQFTGELPATIRGMKSLKNFRGSDNQFQGEIPIDIGKLLKLEYLMLDSNQLTGVPPVELGELKELKAVHLHDNNLSGEVPEAVCDLRNSFFLNDLQADCEDDIIICECCTTCH